MKKSVWKYPIVEPCTNFTVEMPAGSQILNFKIENDIPCIFALVDIETVLVDTKRFLLVGTGDSFDVVDELNFIGTIQMNKLVFHLFEKL